MPNIKHKLIIKAPIDKVFKAITEQQGLAAWWTSQNNAKPEIGAIITFDFGDRYHNEMEILRLEKNRYVEWVCRAGDREWIDTHFVFDLETVEDHSTTLRFGHIGWRQETDFYANCNYHWGYYMISLKEYCETGKGTPFEV